MQNKQDEYRDAKVINNIQNIKNKIAVMSNKGGVGKSTVSVNLAVLLSKKGFKVGLLDVDLHGPSVFKMLGVEGKKIMAMENQILPEEVNGLKVVSMAGLIEDSDSPLIWRGPLKMNIIKEFLGNVEWGDLDYLIIDLPPGTGDEPLSICQLIPELNGFVIVTTPQEVATLDTRKSIGFANKINIPVIGVIENMSGMICPHCHENIDIFGKGGGRKISQDFNLKFLGELSFEPQVVLNSDKGKLIIDELKETKIREQFEAIVFNIECFIENKCDFKEEIQMKKIAIPVTQGQFSMHFGHCEEFAIFEVEGKEIKNKVLITPPPHEPGVLPKFLHAQGVSYIIAGGMGMRAQGLFKENGIEVIVGAMGTDPDEVIKAYLAGILETGDNVCDH
jgi:ATP-binding protein involved in chromosome partitioning